jgi:phospholipase/carboxylesterase
MAYPAPEVAVAGDLGTAGPLVVLLHGRGSHEKEIIALADHLPPGPTYAAVRAPIAEGGGFAWFANRGIGRPLPDSLRLSIDWFRGWLDTLGERPVHLVGFSGGAAFAGGLLLDAPSRFASTAILYGTLPFDAGVPTTPRRLPGVPVFLAHGEQDRVIPPELQARTWSYLHDESGATLTARRDPGGHGIAAPALTALHDWLAARIA